MSDLKKISTIDELHAVDAGELSEDDAKGVIAGILIYVITALSAAGVLRATNPEDEAMKAAADSGICMSSDILAIIGEGFGLDLTPMFDEALKDVLA